MSSAASIQAAMTNESDRNHHPYHWAELHLIVDHQGHRQIEYAFGLVVRKD